MNVQKRIFKYKDVFGEILIMKLDKFDTVFFSLPDFIKCAKIKNFTENYNKLVEEKGRGYVFTDAGGKQFTNLSFLKALMEHSNLTVFKKIAFIDWLEDIEKSIKSEEDLMRENEQLKEDVETLKSLCKILGFQLETALDSYYSRHPKKAKKKCKK